MKISVNFVRHAYIPSPACLNLKNDAPILQGDYNHWIQPAAQTTTRVLTVQRATTQH